MKDEPFVIVPKRPKGDDGYKVFSIRVREELVKQVDELAAQTGHSRNELISKMITYSLNKYLIEEPGKGNGDNSE